METYPDFHLAIATVSPLFLLAGVVAQLRMIGRNLNDVPRRFLAPMFWVGPMGLALIEEVIALLVLGGLVSSSRGLRIGLLVALVVQMVTTIGGIAWEAGQAQQRPGRGSDKVA